MISAPSSLRCASLAEGVGQPLEPLAVGVGPEVAEPGLCHRGRGQLVGVDAHRKSDPPSTLTLAPVTYPLAREARKATTTAISSGSPARPRSAG